MERAERLRALNAYQLARIADCGDPDTTESMGAEFLLRIADSLAEAIEDKELDEDRISDIVSNSPNTYTHQMWQEFVDLCAYQQDTSDYGKPESINDQAAYALIDIAQSLVDGLHTDYLEGALSGDDEEDELDEDAPIGAPR